MESRLTTVIEGARFLIGPFVRFARLWIVQDEGFVLRDVLIVDAREVRQQCGSDKATSAIP